MTPTQRVLADLTAHNCNPAVNGKGWSARCPAHDDQNPSLSISEGNNGGAVLCCHRGCDTKDVVAAIGLTMADLMPERIDPTPSKPKANGKARIVDTHDYRDEAGELLFQVVRYDPKSFKQRQPKVGGGWNWSVKGVRVVPYRLPELLAEPTRPVVVVEGEKDANNLARIGVLTTCNAAGAGKWKPEHAQFLRDRRVIIVADNDAAGKKHAQQVATSLQSIAASVRVVELPGLDEKGDVSDWLAAGGTRDELKRLVDATPIWTPAEAIEESSDNDKPSNPDGNKVLESLAAALADNGAAGVYQHEKLLKKLAKLEDDDLPKFAEALTILRDAKVPIGEFKKVIKTFSIAKQQQQSTQLSRIESGGFSVSNGCICRTRMVNDNQITEPIANHVAKICDVTTYDDGAERQIVLGIVGKRFCGEKFPRTEVEAEQFSRLDWMLSAWGPRAIVWQHGKLAMPSAIQAISQTQTTRTVFAHTGWTRIDSRDVYLHAGGAIGAKNSNQIAVKLTDTLAKFELPDPVDGKKQNEAIAASLRMLELAPDKITVPLLALVFRSVLRASDFGMHLAGTTGVCKSELAGLAQRHFGTGLDRENLPGSWSSTVNSLERNLFFAKDALFTIDDFAPGGTMSDVARLHRDADRLFRAQGNQAGRLRMKRDGRLDPPKPPRGTVLSTGECSPRGQSILARLLVIEVGPKEVDLGKLTECQDDAKNGLYVQAMSCFLAWLAPQYQEIKKIHTSKVTEIRDQITRSGQHARTPGIIAELIFATRLFLRFARQVGAISETEKEQLRERTLKGLIEAGNAQTSQQASYEPTEAFLRLLSSVISSGRAHIAGPDGNEPSDVPNTWGWRLATIGTGNFMRQEWQAKGRCIGWVDEEGIYLDPGSTFAEVQKLGSEQGHALGITAQTLWRRLKEKHLLVACESGRMTIRRKLGGVTRPVLHLRADALSPAGDADEPNDDTKEGNKRNGQDGPDSQGSGDQDEPGEDGIF